MFTGQAALMSNNFSLVFNKNRSAQNTEHGHRITLRLPHNIEVHEQHSLARLAEEGQARKGWDEGEVWHPGSLPHSIYRHTHAQTATV